MLVERWLALRSADSSNLNQFNLEMNHLWYLWVQRTIFQVELVAAIKAGEEKDLEIYRKGDEIRYVDSDGLVQVVYK